MLLIFFELLNLCYFDLNFINFLQSSLYKSAIDSSDRSYFASSYYTKTPKVLAMDWVSKNLYYASVDRRYIVSLYMHKFCLFINFFRLRAIRVFLPFVRLVFMSVPYLVIRYAFTFISNYLVSY